MADYKTAIVDEIGEVIVGKRQHSDLQCLFGWKLRKFGGEQQRKG